jgi:poly(3-hydroxybutyrate) depolymerase
MQVCGPDKDHCVENLKRMIRKLFLTLAVLSTASFSMVSAQQTAKVTASGIGYLEYLPQGYHSNSNKYPIVISLHGVMEKGTSSRDPKRVLADLHRVDNVGLPKYVRQGKKYPFIMISPQLKSNMGMWSGSYIMEVLNYVKKHLRVDERRIYLTGLSLGGFGVWRTAGDYPKVFAAIAPICAGGNALSKADEIAAADLPVWGFHGSSDRIVSHNVTVKMVNAINSKRPNPMAKATIFRGMGHPVWDKAYNDTNVLSWMLSYKKGSSSRHRDEDDNEHSGDHNSDDHDSDDDDSDDDDSTDGDKNSSNKRPVVRAGSDKTITLPTNALHIRGSATDPDGEIKSLEWTQVSGGRARLSATKSERLKAYNLEEGTYVFRLTAKDNDGARRSDEVRVTVRKGADKETGKSDNEKKPSSENVRPWASAGPDRTIFLPTNSITIKASASDKDGKIVSYQWAQTYGQRVSLSGEESEQVRIHNLKEGKFIFRLRVKDNDGAIRDDYFKITVKDREDRKNVSQNNSNNNDNSSPSRKSNRAPKAWAGRDIEITLPTNSVDIRANASDRDGKVVSYEWRKISGYHARIHGRNSSHVRIDNLRKGVYVFLLRVTDNDGAVAKDYVKITVKDSGKDVARNDARPNSQAHSRNANPVAYAGPDRHIKTTHGPLRLSGSARDRDGEIVSYKWRKLAGPGRVTVKNADSLRPTISNLKEGRYYFSLTVKDDENATHVDKMAIRVTGS